MKSFITFNNVKKTYKVGDVEINASYGVDFEVNKGDIYMTYDGINLNSFYLVRGNNDFGNIPDELFITIDDLKFYIVHGHRYDVDYNLDYHIGKETWPCRRVYTGRRRCITG